MEYWDLYDKNRRKLKKTGIRGECLEDNEYHLVINAWIQNDQKEFLISQRSKNKPHPLMWEVTGGSAIKGETSKEAALREIKEELGEKVNPKDGALIGSTFRYYEGCPDILDVWLFHSNVSIEEIVCQKEEVNNVMWASAEKIRSLLKEDKFEANPFFEKVLDNELKIENLLEEKIPLKKPPNKSKEYPIILSIPAVIGKYDILFFPTYIKIMEKNQKEIGADYEYPKKLEKQVLEKLKQYSKEIGKKLKEEEYKGVLEINYILSKEKLYFTSLKTGFPKSSSLIDSYLEKYCNTNLSELNYLAITNKKIGNNYLESIDGSIIYQNQKTNKSILLEQEELWKKKESKKKEN